MINMQIRHKYANEVINTHPGKSTELVYLIGTHILEICTIILKKEKKLHIYNFKIMLITSLIFTEKGQNLN